MDLLLQFTLFHVRISLAAAVYMSSVSTSILKASTFFDAFIIARASGDSPLDSEPITNLILQSASSAELAHTLTVNHSSVKVTKLSSRSSFIKSSSTYDMSNQQLMAKVSYD
jgi:hypothetical protein